MSTWDDKPNDYEAALTEIERLRALCDPDYDRGFLVAYKAHIIEECARVAESLDTSTANMMGWAIARGIRALKNGTK